MRMIALGVLVSKYPDGIGQDATRANCASCFADIWVPAAYEADFSCERQPETMCEVCASAVQGHSMSCTASQVRFLLAKGHSLKTIAFNLALMDLAHPGERAEATFERVKDDSVLSDRLDALILGHLEAAVQALLEED